MKPIPRTSLILATLLLPLYGLTAAQGGAAMEVHPFRPAPFTWQVTPRHDYARTFVTKLFMSQSLFDGELHGTFKLRDNGRQRNFLTCEQALELIKGMDTVTLGLPKIVYLVGWQYNGHDSKYPAFFEANPAVKRPQDATAFDSLRWLMAEARKYHTAVSLHINMFDAYTDSPLFEEYRRADVLARDKEGHLLTSDWGYTVSYAAEWAKGLAQKRLDRLLSLLPIAEAGTLHIDAFHSTLPYPVKEGDKWTIHWTSPISPGHGYTEADEVAAQLEIIRYLDARGIDVTIEGVGEGLAEKAFNGYIPLYFHYGNVNMKHNLAFSAQQATGVNIYGPARCFGFSVDGERLFRENPDHVAALEDFKRQFCTSELVFLYLNSFSRKSLAWDGHGAAAGELDCGIKTSLNGDRFAVVKDGAPLVEDGNVFIPAAWCGPSCLVAFSRDGYERKTWTIPRGTGMPRELAAWTITPTGRTPFKEFSSTGRQITLSLTPGQMVVLGPRVPLFRSGDNLSHPR